MFSTTNFVERTENNGGFYITVFFTIYSFIVSFPFSTACAFKCFKLFGEVIIFAIVAVNPNN